MELIVAMVVFMVIMTATTAIFMPMWGSFRRANNLAEINTVFDTLSMHVIADVQMAGQITTTAPTQFNITTQRYGIITYYIYNQQLVRRIGNTSAPLLDEGFARQIYLHNFSIAPVPTDPGLVQITITLAHRTDHWQPITREFFTRPIGLV